MTLEEAQAVISAAVPGATCHERRCVARPGSWLCTGGRSNCPKGHLFYVVEQDGISIARGDTWEQVLDRLFGET